MDFAIRAAIALKSPHIAPVCRFDRKHYFYPDLPNGYQITQYFDPIARGGKVYLMRDALHGGETSDRHHHHHQNLDAVDIQQIQIEQDSGKTISGVTTGGVTSGLVSLVDLNRAGVGVLEIVTEPCITSSAQAVSFLKTIYRILWHHGITNPNIEDVNAKKKKKKKRWRGGKDLVNQLTNFHSLFIRDLGV